MPSEISRMTKEVCSVQPRAGSHLSMKRLIVQVGKIDKKWKCWQSSHHSLLVYERKRGEGTASPQKVCPWLIYFTVPQGLERNASFSYRRNLIAQTSFRAWEGPDQKTSVVRCTLTRDLSDRDRRTASCCKPTKEAESHVCQQALCQAASNKRSFFSPRRGMCTGSCSDAIQTLFLLLQKEYQDTCEGILLDCSSRSLLWRLAYFGLAFNTTSLSKLGMDVTSSVLKEKAGESQEVRHPSLPGENQM